MLNPIQKLLSKITRKKESKYQASLMMATHALYLLIYQNGEKKPIYAKSLEKQEEHSWNESIKAILDNEYLASARLNIVLPGSEYQMLIVDRPEVEEQELLNALRYSAVEYVSGNLEDIVVEYFDIPVQPSGQKKVNLIAANRTFIQDLLKLTLPKCNELQRITVDELAYLDLFREDHDASMLVVHQPKEELLMQIVKDGQIYFFRRIRGYLKLDTFAELEISHGAADGLSLEIQRSLDYFESQLHQPPVKRIYVAVQSPHQALLIDKIGENFSLPVLPLKNRLADELPEDSDNQGYFPAIGAVQELLHTIEQNELTPRQGEKLHEA